MNSTHSHRLDMLVVLDLGELLRHRVYHHLVRWAVLEDDLVRRDLIPHKVVANVHVLSALVLDGILGEVDAAAVVGLDVNRPIQVVRLRHEHGDALDELVEPNSLLAGLAKSQVLRLYGR